MAAGSTYPAIEAGVQMLMRIGFTRRARHANAATFNSPNPR